MNNTVALFLLLSILVSCNSSTSSTNQTASIPTDSLQSQKDSTKSPSLADISNEEAKSWLIKAIDTYFNSDNQDMQSLTTQEYFEFKTDAMNVDLDVDDSLTQEEFEAKWKDKFDLSTHPTQIGFLISGQDWDRIEVKECHQIQSSEANRIKFKTTLVDSALQAKYTRDIIIIKNKDSFKIADVIEYD